MNKFYALLLTVIFSSCLNEDFTASYELGNFKILALIADQPEVDAGDVVQITPYLSDINGEGRTIRVSSSGCLDPGIGVGATPTCENSASEVVLADNILVTGLTAPYYTGDSGVIVTVPVPNSAIIYAGVPAEAQAAGVNYLVTFEFTSNGETIEKTFRRIKVSTNPVKNSNPVYATPGIVDEDANDLQTLTNNTEFSGRYTPASREEYIDIATGQSKEEELSFSWYVSRGELSVANTDLKNTTVWTKNERNSLPFILVGVLRDPRGGMTILQKTF